MILDMILFTITHVCELVMQGEKSQEKKKKKEHVGAVCEIQMKAVIYKSTFTRI